MADRFFTAKECDRCGGELRVRHMSRFNTDVLCPACIEEEKKHPDYEKAAEAELAAVRRGDMNFPGIGWPGKDGRVSDEKKTKNLCIDA
jgi:ssDNA-binding Zn-finger/Zn-ribbon topoisomerase 1